MCRFVFLFFIQFLGVAFYAQSNLSFEYAYSEKDFSDDLVSSRVELINPEEEIFTLYSNTLPSYKYSIKDKLIDSGEYTLKTYFYSCRYGNDFLFYKFTMKGNEKEVSIWINFDVNMKNYLEDGTWMKRRKQAQGKIDICKYYKSPDGIKITYAPNIRSTKFYKEPFFTLENNTSDTLYGSYLSGYFWGILSFQTPNSDNMKIKTGTIDYNFGYSPPLYPDSTRIATVGSFGLYGLMPKSKYTYTLLFSNRPQPSGIKKYMERESFVWWADDKEYYKLEYEFEIK